MMSSTSKKVGIGLSQLSRCVEHPSMEIFSAGTLIRIWGILPFEEEAKGGERGPWKYVQPQALRH
jgi:hypothetical protein